MNVLLLSRDLMVSSALTGAVARCGGTLKSVSTSAQLLAACGSGAVDLVVLDLSTDDCDPVELLPQLRGLPGGPGRIIAFGPHVHEARLERARDAGCDDVLSRGQFHGQMDSVLAGS